MRRVEIRDDGHLLVEGEARLAGVEGPRDGAAELVLREKSSDQERRVSLALADSERASDFNAVLSLRSLAGAEGETSVWGAYVALDGAGSGEERLPASADARLAPTAVIPVDSSLYRVRPRRRHQGHLSVTVKRLPPHAEVTQVRVEDAAVAIDGFLPGADAGSSEGARLLARRRRDEREVSAPASIDGDRFSARLDLLELVDEGDATDVWGLRLDAAGVGDLRLGAHLDDVRDKKEVFIYPPRTLSRGDAQRRLRPYFTVENNLSIRSKPIRGERDRPAPASESPAPAPEKESPRRLARRRAELTLATAVQRVATWAIRAMGHGGAARLLPRPKPGPGERPKVHIAILSAYGMGGTIRTVINLANYLAEHYEVELISVIRRRERPAFPIAPGVKITSIDDRRKSAGRQGFAAWVHRLLSASPSLLVHPDDYGYEACSLWSDLMLARKVLSLRSGILVTTRPALNLIAAGLAPPGLITVGQEHQNFHAHRPGLAAAIRRDYSKLDALAVLTHDDLRDYGEMLASAPTRVVRITNALPPDIEGGRATLDTKTVVAGGRLTYQKGFDRLIPAFAPVARRHPDWRLRIYGGGKKRGELRQLILEHDLYNNVFLMGTTERLGEELSKGALFALSSRYEGFGMVLIEAMSKGLPVVSFDCPRGPSEIISPDHDGILVPEGDIPALSEGLLELIEDEDKRHRFGSAALGKAGAYDIEVIGRQWDRLFEELVAREAAAPTS